MSPFVVAVEQNIAVAQYEQGWGRGGKGRQLSPFQPAHRLLELDCTHLPVPRFPEKNFAPGWLQNDELQLGRPIVSPALAFVFLLAVRIHSEASMPATMRRGGIATFFDQVGFR
jgi:hypothetical protein